MPFELNENATADMWVNVAVPPWVSGDPPTHEAVPVQKIKSWLAIDGNQVAGLEAGGIGIVRIMWGPDPHPSAAWTEVTGNVSYVQLRCQFDPGPYYSVLAVDHWWDAGDITVSFAWLTLQWDGNPS